jgi:hypothetical protein
MYVVRIPDASHQNTIFSRRIHLGNVCQIESGGVSPMTVCHIDEFV